MARYPRLPEADDVVGRDVLLSVEHAHASLLLHVSDLYIIIKLIIKIKESLILNRILLQKRYLKG